MNNCIIEFQGDLIFFQLVRPVGWPYSEGRP